MKKNKIISAIFIVFLASILRIFLNEKVGIPNFEAQTSLILLSGSFLGQPYSFIIPILTMFLSDLYFSNNLVYLFTWSAFILTGVLGSLIKTNIKYYFLKITGAGIFSVLFFYLWTNFGWWLTFGMYPMTFRGLIDCYIAGLPFLKNQLLSLLIFIPIFCPFFSFYFERFKIIKKKFILKNYGSF